MEETQIGCTPNIFFPHRVHYYSEFEEKYDLELVAGNYYQNPWSGFWTEQMLCNVTRCAKQPIPFPIEGVNDRPECEARSVIQDITVVSPVLSKRKDYARYRSLFSLYCITSEIKNLYPKYSTGKVKDFSAISGSYNGVPYGTENQEETFQQLRERFITLARNTNNIEN